MLREPKRTSQRRKSSKMINISLVFAESCKAYNNFFDFCPSGWKCCISCNKLALFHAKWPILLGIVVFITTLARITLNGFNKVVRSITLHALKTIRLGCYFLQFSRIVDFVRYRMFGELLCYNFTFKRKLVPDF